MLSPNQTLAYRDALAEMHELLRHCSEKTSPPRDLAARYQVCRSTLIMGEFARHVPGFVRQCVSLTKFIEFICLLDSDPSARIIFIDNAFEGCWQRMNGHSASRGFAADVF
jgi:hypothetical protein